jgi:hypothetical protein
MSVSGVAEATIAKWVKQLGGSGKTKMRTLVGRF